MDVEFADDDLAKVEGETGYSGRLPQQAITPFRKKMQFIRSAVDERDFYEAKSLHFEKMSGTRSHQHSMRLNDQYRLIVELQKGSAAKVVRIMGIEDYH